MIPYEELVIALQAWRAKKGLPIGQMSGSLVPPPPAVAPPPPPARAASAAGPAAPGSGPNRSAPPAPPRAASAIPTGSYAPAGSPSSGPLTTQSNEAATDTYRGLPEAEDEHAEAVEEHEYANEGDDFAMAFQNLQVAEEGEGEGDESTSIGAPPAPGRGESGDPTLPRTGRRSNDDW